MNRSVIPSLKRNGPRAALAIAASLIVVSLGACQSSTPDEISPRKQRALDSLRPVPKKLLRIDEVAGTYAGVGLGDSGKDVMRVFGPSPLNGKYETHPLDASPSGTGPSYSCDGVGRQSDFLRYRGVTFWVNRGAVCDVRITAEGIETRRGVAVGDSLAEAERAYSGLRCGKVNANTEYVPYDYCLGRLGPRRFIWFSGYEGEPIDDIELGIYPFCASCVRKPSFYR